VSGPERRGARSFDLGYLKAIRMKKLAKCVRTLSVAFGLAVGTGEMSAFVYNGHQYQLTTSAENWTDAEAEAVSLGGHLVAINDAAEQSFLQTAFNDLSATAYFYYWIGLSDAASEGTWVWSNGEPTTYLNWAGLEPSSGNTAENYVMMNFENNSRHGQWHDVDVGRSLKGIVEIPSLPDGGSTASLICLGLFSLRLLAARTPSTAERVRGA